MIRSRWLGAAAVLALGAQITDSADAQMTITPPPSDACDRPWRASVLVIYDLEGISGITSTDQLLASSARFDESGPLVALDVNAVVEGLVQGGASHIAVADGHGSGAAVPDLPPELLDPRAEPIDRGRPFFPSLALAGGGAYDAVVLVGYKSRTRGGGFAAHTRTFGLEFLVERQPVNEPELIALSFGAAGIPVVMVSGDDVLRQEMADYPWITYVQVKTTIDTQHAEPLTMELAQRRLTEGARRSLTAVCQAPLLTLAAGSEVGLRALPPASFAALSAVPGVSMPDHNTYVFKADSFHDAQAGWGALTSVALGGWFLSARRVLEQPGQDPGEEVLFEALRESWVKAEAGEPLAPRQEGEPATFHGIP